MIFALMIFAGCSHFERIERPCGFMIKISSMTKAYGASEAQIRFVAHDKSKNNIFR